MAKIGLQYPVFSPLTETDSAVAYGSGIVLGKAISVGTSINVADVKLYADDGVAEEDKSFDSGTLTLNSTHLSQEGRVLILGHTLQSAGIEGYPEVMEVVSKDGDEGPYGGFGFYGKEKINGATKFHAYFLTKVKFKEPNDDFETKGETTAFQTPTIEGDIHRDVTGLWKRDIVVETEAQAKAWLNELANIGEPADFAALSSAVTAADLLVAEDYTSGTWVAFANALADAKVVQAITGASQSRVDAATLTLTAAQGLLIERA